MVCGLGVHASSQASQAAGVSRVVPRVDAPAGGCVETGRGEEGAAVGRR